MKRENSVFVILGILFGLNVLAWIGVYGLAKPNFLEITFFDVGQGDAILIESPKGHQILIDGGPSSAVLERLGREMPFWDRTIDLIILTHPDHDHIAGLLEVLKSYEVENILWTGIKKDTSEYEEWLRLIEKEDANVFVAQSGQKVITQRTVLSILYPFESLEGKEVKNANNTSVVVKLIFDENSFLFTGDAYKSVEKELIEKETALASNLLKVGHHGSKTSTSQEFIKDVLPEIAVISVGENKWGHPHQETLAILAEYGIRVLRTDQDGDIKIISDGTGVRIK